MELGKGIGAFGLGLQVAGTSFGALGQYQTGLDQYGFDMEGAAGLMWDSQNELRNAAARSRTIFNNAQVFRAKQEAQFAKANLQGASKEAIMDSRAWEQDQSRALYMGSLMSRAKRLGAEQRVTRGRAARKLGSQSALQTILTGGARVGLGAYKIFG